MVDTEADCECPAEKALVTAYEPHSGNSIPQFSLPGPEKKVVWPEHMGDIVLTCLSNQPSHPAQMAKPPSSFL